jgi:site-specific DNA-cytosine methylase
MKKQPTFISFFSGIEGFRLGLEAAGWKCVHSVEIDDFCGKVQEARYGHRPQSRDIIKLKARDLPYADLWVAGWPCQGLSVAGLRKGLADGRSGLFWEFVRLLEQKRPPGFLAENVPGLLTTCSCPRCGFQCKDCGAAAGAEDESCEMCGSENLGGKVLPAHRGTDLFVVLTALQSIGYGVQERILDAQYLGVPQRRRRIFFVGNLGAPCRPEILFEPESGTGDFEAGREEGQVPSRELARSLGAVGGGNDYGANKGTLVKPRVASPITAGTHPGFQDRGDGLDNIVAKAITASAGHHGHSSPRGDGSDNLVAGTLQSCTKGQGRKTPEVDQLVAPQAVAEKAHAVAKSSGGGLGGRDGQDDYVLIRVDQTSSDPVIRKDRVTDSIATGTGHGGYANQAIARHEPKVFEPRFARNGRGAPDVVAPPLKAQNGSTGKGDGAPCVAYGISPDALNRSGEGKGGSNSERSGLGITKNLSPSVRASHAPAVASPLTAGSNPNSHMAGRRREDDQNLLAQQPLFIHTADANANQGQVKKNGKADCLSKAQPGVVAFHSTGGGQGISDQALAPPLTVGTGLDIPSPPAVAYDVRGMAQGGQSHAVESDTTGTVDTDGRNPSGNEAGTLVGPSPMSVRRLTPTECERLQGVPDGWTCTCGVRPDCPDRRIPPWLDPSTFKLQGCGHSACGCTCPDSPRYKTLGNAVATCAVHWIGVRLAPAVARKSK